MSEAAHTPPTEIAVKKETTKEPQLTRFVIDKSAFDEETYKDLAKKANGLNRLGEFTAILKTWVDRKPSLLNSNDPPGEILDKVERLKTTIGGIFDLETQLETSLSPDASKETKDLTDDDIEKLVSTLGLVNPPREKPTVITIKNLDQVEELNSRLSIVPTILHDLRGPIHTLISPLDLIEIEIAEKLEENKPPDKDIIDGAIEVMASSPARLKNNSIYCLRLLEDPYPREDVEIGYFTKKLRTELGAGVAVEVKPLDPKAKPVTHDEKIRWARPRIDSITYNLAQNIRKAIEGTNLPREATIRYGKYIEAGRRFLQIYVEDGGHGFPDEIVEKGFQPRFTKWKKAKGTGIGMHSQLVALEDHYGGKLIPKNIIENGKIVGGRVIIRVPLV